MHGLVAKWRIRCEAYIGICSASHEMLHATRMMDRGTHHGPGERMSAAACAQRAMTGVAVWKGAGEHMT